MNSSNFTPYEYLNKLFGLNTKSKWHIILFILYMLLHQAAIGQDLNPVKSDVRGSWRIIGTVEARFAVDHDGIVVEPPYDNIKKIQVKVTGAPLRLLKLQVTYSEGEPDFLPIRVLIPQGGVSRTFNLPAGGKRHIRRIDFWYDTGGVTNGQAIVTILGMI